jgi:hypothetical protein
VVREPELQEWLHHPNPWEKLHYPVTQEVLSAIDRFYFNHYCESFRSGAFARANSSMYVWLSLGHLTDCMSLRLFSSPMLNMLGDLMCDIYGVASIEFPSS